MLLIQATSRRTMRIPLAWIERRTRPPATALFKPKARHARRTRLRDRLRCRETRLESAERPAPAQLVQRLVHRPCLVPRRIAAAANKRICSKYQDAVDATCAPLYATVQVSRFAAEIRSHQCSPCWVRIGVADMVAPTHDLRVRSLLVSADRGLI
jgi:hypothetical protein